MPEGQVLEFTHVTKRFNEVTAVSDFSARVEPGAVTAFLGPNGAGKTTTLRILLGQVRATSGTATIGGTTYAELRQPLRTIGAVLEETVYRPRRTAERQLTIAAKANGIPLARVGEVLSLVGLDGEGDSRIGGFSLGMRQRLSVAHALLGDPGALVFDEPANGLDPEGIRWMRLLMRRLADEGRTVLVSSHVLSEVEQVADNVLVLSKGRLVLASGIETLADPKGGSVIVDAADRAALTTALTTAGFDIEVLRSGLTVRGGDAGTVGAVAAEAGIALSTLVQRGPTLEDVFIDLMRGGRLAQPAETTPAPLAAAAAPVETDAPTEATAPAEADSAAAVADEASAAPAPVDSVVAIPVAAAAAWAAEATAAPASESLADEVAEAQDAADRDDADRATEERPTEEESTEEQAPATPAVDGAAATSEVAAAAPGTDDLSPEDAPAEDAPADADHADVVESSDHAESTPEEARADEAVAAPAPSFDEILFGAAPAPAATDDADADLTVPISDDSDDRAGVEIFSELEDATVDGDEVTDHATDDATDHDAEESDEDPRSAAVSSMLAAAAKAYYEDEPKDYPLDASDSASSEGTSEGGAHWSVASTGVIDTVPLADADADSAGADSADAHSDTDESSDSPEGDSPEQHSEENAGEHHADEHHGEGEHHADEHHGDQHHG